jgi:hypothetical protein
MEKRIIGESRDTVVFNTEHSTLFSVIYKRRNRDINAFPFPGYTHAVSSLDAISLL